MSIVLRYKISTTIGIVLLMTITIFSIVTITDRAFSSSYDIVETAQMSQLDSIRRTIGQDMSRSNTDNWNIYKNVKYNFSIKYPETLMQVQDEKLSMYKEDDSENSIQPTKITFENFIIKIWDNSSETELGKFFASAEVCALETAFCRNFKRIDEIAFTTITMSDNYLYQTNNGSDRFFIPFPDNQKILDIELINSKAKKEFNKIVSTLSFE